MHLRSSDFVAPNETLDPNAFIDPHDLAELRRLAGLPVLEDANMMMGQNDSMGNNPVKAGENPWGIKSPVGTTGANFDKRKIEKEKKLVPGTDEWFRLWFSKDEKLTADDFEEQKPEDAVKGNSLMSKPTDPTDAGGSTNESATTANFLGTCVNSFDEDGTCVVPGLYTDTSDFAVHEENADEITPQEFKTAVGQLPANLSSEVGDDLVFLHDADNNIYMLYDCDADVHYFFKGSLREDLPVVKKRKKRNDVNHAIYVVTNVLTGEQYIGITAIRPNLKKALWVRMQKHVQRAKVEDKDWGLCKSIREYGAEAFTFGVLEIVRGKKPAHARELELVRMYHPSLNTFR